jgi:hypothetical protein
MPTCHRHYPGRSDEACPLVYLHRQRPSLCNSQVGSCNCFFGACSAFTHVMACTLAESLNDPFHRKLRQLRCLRRRFDCYRVERTSSRAGIAPAEVQRLSRRTVTSTWFSTATNSQPFGTPTPATLWAICLDTGYFEGRLVALSRILYLPAPVIRLNRPSSQHFQRKFIEIHRTFALVKNQEEAL